MSVVLSSLPLKKNKKNDDDDDDNKHTHTHIYHSQKKEYIYG